MQACERSKYRQVPAEREPDPVPMEGGSDGRWHRSGTSYK